MVVYVNRESPSSLRETACFGLLVGFLSVKLVPEAKIKPTSRGTCRSAVRWAFFCGVLAFLLLAGCSPQRQEGQDAPQQQEPVASHTQPLCTVYQDCVGPLPICYKWTCDLVTGAGVCKQEIDLGAACDDGDLCTQDSCNIDGKCVGVPKICQDDGNPCNGTEQCDGSSGKCTSVNPPPPDDGNPCNGQEVCTKGKNGQIVYRPIVGTVPPDGTPCADDENVCTSDVCKNKKCIHREKTLETINDPCTVVTCNAKTGEITISPHPKIDDGNPCTADLCYLTELGGKMIISHPPLTPEQMDDGNPCTADTCNPSTGVTHSFKAIGAACSDKNSCTNFDHCDGQGVCVGVTDPTPTCKIVPPPPPNVAFQPDLPSGVTKSVGTIPGQFAVSPSGAAQYSLSFEVPPGRAGMTPVLGLGYSSDQGNSIAGVGFSISGLSAISRCPMRLEPDGFVREVRYDQLDNFCLDGAQLVPINLEKTEFRTVPETFSRITLFTESGISGPAWFKVETKDGKILFYGNEPEGEERGARAWGQQFTVRNWLLHTVQDRYGSKIQYSYGGWIVAPNSEGPEGNYTTEVVLNEVFYPPNNRVKFIYDPNRPDPSEHFTKGMRLTQTSLLTSVEVFSDELFVRRYSLTYEDPQQHASKKSRLAKIQECADETLCKPSTNFTWNGGQAGYEKTLFQPTSPTNGSSIWNIWDWNGDGLHETVFSDLYAESDPTFGDLERRKMRFVRSKNKDGVLTTSLPDDVSNPNLDLGDLNYVGEEELCHAAVPQFVVFDYDGDGKDDLVVTNRTSANGNLLYVKADDVGGDSNVVGTYYKEAFGIKMPPLNLPIEGPTNCLSLPPQGALFFLDLNGDGLQDMVQCYPGGAVGSAGSPSQWAYLLHKGNGYDGTEWGTQPLLSGVPCSADAFVFDENGDGRQELVLKNEFSSTQFRSFYLSYEDSKIASSIPGQQGMYPPKVAFEPSSVPAFDAVPTKNYKPLDVNGDGLLDLVVLTKEALDLVTYINTGKGFLPPIVSIQGHEEIPDFAVGGAFFWALAIPLDYNGDGRVDLLLPGEVLESTPGTNQWKRGPSPVEFTHPRWPPGAILLPTDLSSLTYQSQRSIDIDGNGFADVIGFEQGGHMVGWKSTLHEEDTLLTIDDGLRSREAGEPEYAPTVTIQYGHLLTNNYQNYSNFRSCTYPTCYVTGTQRVVNFYAVNNGTEGTRYNHFHFYYKNGRREAFGGRWLGFEERTIKQIFADDHTVEITEKYGKIEQKIHEFYPFANHLTSRDTHTFYQDKQHHVHETFEPVYRPTFWGGNPDLPITYFVYNEKITQSNFYDIDATESSYEETSLDVDGFGNVGTKIIKTLEPSAFNKTIKSQYLNDTTNWIIGRSTTVSVCEKDALAEFDGCGTTTTTYNGQGDPASILVDASTPKDWLRTTFFRDSSGNITGAVAQDYHNETRESWVFFDEQRWYPYARVNALGHVQLEKYDKAFGTLLQVVDPNGATQRHAYDKFGRLTSTEGVDGVVQNVALDRVRNDSNEIVTSIRTSSTQGQDSTSFINLLGQAKQTQTKGFGGQIFTQISTYNRLGQLTVRTPLATSSLASNPKISYKYDFLGRISDVTTPDQKTIHYDYFHRKSVVVDPKGNKATHLFDELGRLKQAIDAKGQVTSYVHGAFGSIRVTTPDGKSTTTQKNWRGRLLASTDPNQGTFQYVYNGFGELTQEINALHTIDYTYDKLGRLVTRKSGQELSSWTWDEAPHGVGQLASTQSADQHKEAYEYDSIGRLTAVHTTPLENPTYTTRLEYDKGRVSRITYPRGSHEPGLSVRYQYDNQGLLIAVLRDNQRLNEALWRWTAVDDLGNATQERFGNGLKTKRVYNPLTGLLEHTETGEGLATGPINNPFQSLSFGYDENHNLKFRTDELLGLEEDFNYDELNRLTSARVGAQITNYQYDEIGNIRAIYNKGRPKIWKYDPNHPHAVKQAFRDGNTLDFSYDKLGRQTLRNVPHSGPTQIRYTSFNKPKAFTPRGEASSSQNSSVSLTYNSFHNRVTKVSAQGDTLYINQLYERFVDASTGETTIKYFVTNQERVVAVIQNKREPFSLKQPWKESTSYLHPDHLGSPTLITNQDGKTEARRSYDAFGKARSWHDWTSAPEGSSEALQASGFTGHEDEEELGLVHMQGRMYDPNISRFLTPDPIIQAPTFSQSWNRYAYVFNNPLNFTDPTGYESDASIHGNPTNEVWIVGEPRKKAVPPPPSEGVDQAGARDPLAGKTVGVDRLPPGGYYVDSLGDKFHRNADTFITISLGVSAVAVSVGVGVLAAGGGALTAAEGAAAIAEGAISTFGGAGAAARGAAQTLGGVARVGAWWVRSLLGGGGAACAGGACNKLNGACFAAGTIVWTAGGPQNIEDIKVGDYVFSKDEKTGDYSWQPVLQVFITPDREILELTLTTPEGSSQTLLVTAEHPFWVSSKGWVPVANLKAEDHVATADSGGWASVQSLRGPPERTQVYNFEVANTHTYFVGHIPTWVHNTYRPILDAAGNVWTGKAAPAEKFIMTHTLPKDFFPEDPRALESIKATSAHVLNTFEKLSKGWRGDPIQVAKIAGKLYITDGHHRWFAVRYSFLNNVQKIPYEIVSLKDRLRAGISTDEEILEAAAQTAQRAYITTRVMNALRSSIE